MNDRIDLTRRQILGVVLESLNDILIDRDGSTDPVDESVALLGAGAVLDSLGLVTLLVDLEQRFDEEYDLSLTLADERALSQRKSPFRTVESLTDYIHQMVEETRQRVGA